MRQVAHRLQAEFPGVQRLATLSPIPGFRAWLDARLRREVDAVRHSTMQYAYLAMTICFDTHDALG